MKPLLVRRATPGDENFVTGLAPRFAETRPLWRSIEEVVDGTVVELHRAFTAPDPGSAIFIAEDSGGMPCGFVYVVMHEDFFTHERHAHVSEIAVERDGTGAGTALMEAAEAYCREQNVRFVTLNVNERNGGAAAFYERLGFEPQVRQFVKVLAPASSASPPGLAEVTRLRE